MEALAKIITITVYHALSYQTDATPLVTASGYDITDPRTNRIIAVSRDLLEEYPFGTTVMVECDCPHRGRYRVEDVMNKRHSNRIDILIDEDQEVGKWKGRIWK